MTVAWVFPGQGSQSVAMGLDLYQHVPEARAVFDQASDVLDFDIARLCFEGPDDFLMAAENVQPALLTMSAAVLRTVEALSNGAIMAQPRFVAGHSLGEYSAMLAGGAFDFATAVRLVRRRGELMALATEGMMAAIIGLNEQQLVDICQEVSETSSSRVVVANYNAPDQLVISGDVEAVERASVQAKDRGAKRVVPLKVSAAFHSPLMSHAAAGMAEELKSAAIGDMQIPLISNITAEPISGAGALQRELIDQIIAPVYWTASVRNMVEWGVSTFVELGAGRVLSGLIRRIAPDVQVVNAGTLEEVREFVAKFES